MNDPLLDPTPADVVLTRLTSRDAEALLALAVDEHVRRFLLDGEIVDRAWAAAEAQASERSLASRQVGLWLVHDVDSPSGGAPIGFCGFKVFAELGPAPQLLYALRQPFTGRGIATRLAIALVEHAHRLGWARIETAVDAPNAASRRVLEKCGFVPCGHAPGAFGDIVLLEHLARPIRRITCPEVFPLVLSVASTWRGESVGSDETVEMRLELTSDELIVRVEAPFHDDPAPAGPPGSTAELWNHEVVELMLLGDDDRYLEVELSPHGHYLVLQLHGQRRVVHSGMALHHAVKVTGARWSGHARVPLCWVPAETARLNAYAIHGRGTARRFLAWAPRHDSQPDDVPDFHDLRRFGSFVRG